MTRKFILFAILLGFCGCCTRTETVNITKSSVSIDSVAFYSIADTVITDMVVKNPDNEDVWTEKCLHQIKRKAFIDTIFNELYAKRLVAYDYYTGKPLLPSEIKKLEKRKDFNRNIVGKFQFYESWFYDNTKHIFMKKVYSIIFGYETFDDRGNVKGYKPMFKIDFE
jgi:hypothetical protein